MERNRDDDRIKIIGDRLKDLRISSGYTSAERFAFEHDISRSQYANYERGTDMRISSLLRILDAHGITLAEFFAEGLE